MSYKSEEGVMGTPKFVAGWAELWVAKVPHLWMVSDIEAVLWNRVLNLWGLC